MGQLHDVIAKFGLQQELRQAPPDVRDFLSQAGVPVEVQNDLFSATFDSDVELHHGCVTIVASWRLKQINLDDVYRPWFDAGYFTVASGATGDPICLDIRTGRMAYILHEEMDYSQPDLVPSEHVVHTPLTYAEFWQRFLDEVFVPCDADNAEEEWGRPKRVPN